MLYILATPTILSAATSYQSASIPFVQIPNSTDWVEVKSLAPAAYIIEDGNRIGLSQNFPVVADSSPSSLYTGISAYWQGLEQLNTEVWLTYQMTWEQEEETEYMTLPGTGDNVTCFNSSLPTNLTFSDQVHHPSSWSFTLNVKEASKSCGSDTYNYSLSTLTYNNRVWNLTAPPLSVMKAPGPMRCTNHIYVQGNTTINGTYILEKAKCQPGDFYRWGFSSLMLFTFCAVTALVGILLMLLHYDSYCYGRADRYDISFSKYRDTFDLADSLRSVGNKDVGCLSPQKLDESLQRDDLRIVLTADNMLPARCRPLNARFASTKAKAIDLMSQASGLIDARFRKRPLSEAEQGFMANTADSISGTLDHEVKTAYDHDVVLDG